jgi:hypothetical protein
VRVERHYEVLKEADEWCLRIRETGRPVAWSKTNDVAFRDYCEEAEADAVDYLKD